MTVDDAKKALLKLFQCFNVSGSDIERKLKFAAYWEVLCMLPAEAVTSACRKAAHGEICNHGFLPTAAELYQVAIASLPRRIPPKIEDYRYIGPGERARVHEGFRKLRAELRANRGCTGEWQTLEQSAARPLCEWGSNASG